MADVWHTDAVHLSIPNAQLWFSARSLALPGATGEWGTCVMTVGPLLLQQKVILYMRTFQIEATRKKEGNSLLFQSPPNFYIEDG